MIPCAQPADPSSETKDSSKNVAALKGGLLGLTDKIAAGAASLNSAISANGQMLLERIQDNSSDDESSGDVSDEETEELWRATTATQSSATATAISIRSQPPPSFISVEEEESIKAQRKEAKELRKKIRKVRKLMKKAKKSAEVIIGNTEEVVTGFHTISSVAAGCIDPTIMELSANAEKQVQELQKGTTLEHFTATLDGQITQQVKPLSDHAKMISVKGRERRIARDKRIRLALEEVDVTNEENYVKSMEIVSDYEEQNRAYKEEYRAFCEHLSSQFGLMLNCYLLETASYLEGLASTLRHCATTATDNWLLSDDCSAKYKDFKIDPKYLAPPPPLFLPHPPKSADDRLTAKPQPGTSDNPPVAGIPMVDENTTSSNLHHPDPEYTTSKYIKSTNSRSSPSISRLLENGDVQEIVNNRSSPIPEISPTVSAHSVIDYIASLKNDYGVQPLSIIQRSRRISPYSSPLSTTSPEGGTIAYSSVLPSIAAKYNTDSLPKNQQGTDKEE